MKVRVKMLLIIALVLFAGLIVFSANASAESAPFLTLDGNYNYIFDSNTGTGALSFTDSNPIWATYVDGSDGCPPYWCANADAIISTDWVSSNYTSEVLFSTFTNTAGDLTIFGSGTFSIYEISNPANVFFSATIDSLDTNLPWNALSNVEVGSGAPSSRYVDELLAIGNGVGEISFSFTPTGGGTEDFTSTSSGAMSVVIAAPEPISAILFVIGGATMALRRYRKRT